MTQLGKSVLPPLIHIEPFVRLDHAEKMSFPFIDASHFVDHLGAGIPGIDKRIVGSISVFRRPPNQFTGKCYFILP